MTQITLTVLGTSKLEGLGIMCRFLLMVWHFLQNRYNLFLVFFSQRSINTGNVLFEDNKKRCKEI